MIFYRLREFAGRLYDNVEIALWAVLLAFVIFMAVFVVPALPALREKYQRARTQEISAENALYCKKLNMKEGTEAYRDCLLVLGDFRLKVEQRAYSESDF
ncbi:MAG TPA: hypothetical protein VFL53_16885 [Pseudolabrys sp.]|nr:hypothetical protein [Pseudolabrys sp.]